MFVGGSGGNPGVRIFCGPTIEWRTQGHLGITSNGGRGTGWGAPTPLEGTCKVNLKNFSTFKDLVTITISKSGNGYDINGQFNGWSSAHPIQWAPGNRINIAAKAFSLKVSVGDVTFERRAANTDTSSAAVAGTTLASLGRRTSDSLMSKMNGLKLG